MPHNRWPPPIALSALAALIFPFIFAYAVALIHGLNTIEIDPNALYAMIAFNVILVFILGVAFFTIYDINWLWFIIYLPFSIIYGLFSYLTGTCFGAGCSP